MLTQHHEIPIPSEARHLDGPNYKVVDYKADVPDTDDLDAYQNFYPVVLDGVTLYGKNNSISSRKDVGEGVADPITDSNNPGIHYNDVQQGGHGDCYTMAALMAIARANWHYIDDALDMGTDEDGHLTFTAILHKHDSVDEISNNATEYDEDRYIFSYTIDQILSRGMDMGRITGDYDDSHDVEIWPLVLESAWADLVGGWGEAQGGSTRKVWQAVTGSPGAWEALENQSATDIYNSISTAFNSMPSKQIVLLTKDAFGSDKKHAHGPFSIPDLGGPFYIYSNHNYLVADELADGQGFELLNPHIPNDTTYILRDELNGLVHGIYILD